MRNINLRDLRPIYYRFGKSNLVDHKKVEFRERGTVIYITDEYMHSYYISKDRDNDRLIIATNPMPDGCNCVSFYTKDKDGKYNLLCISYDDNVEKSYIDDINVELRFINIPELFFS